MPSHENHATIASSAESGAPNSGGGEGAAACGGGEGAAARGGGEGGEGAAARGGGGARATECVLVAQTPFEVDAWASAIRETKGALVTAAGSPARHGRPLTLGP